MPVLPLFFICYFVSVLLVAGLAKFLVLPPYLWSVPNSGMPMTRQTKIRIRLFTFIPFRIRILLYEVQKLRHLTCTSLLVGAGIVFVRCSKELVIKIPILPITILDQIRINDGSIGSGRLPIMVVRVAGLPYSHGCQA